MPPLPFRRPSLAVLVVSCAAMAFSACGGSSVQHVSDDEGGTGGATGGTGPVATGGATSGATGGTATGGTGIATGGTGIATGGTGIATGGTGIATGGTGTAAGGTGTAAGGTGTTGGTGAKPGGTGGKGPLTCDEVVSETQAELARIQSCRADSECGQVLEGTSCGCTHDLVARFDADADRFHDLNDTVINGQQCNTYASTCDCPNANGFVCAKGYCAWNYVNDPPPPPLCTPAPIGSMCIVGVPLDSGDALRVGAPLTLQFRPAGCFSSSCTKVMSASCAVKQDANDFYVVADMCLTENSDPNVGCTDDCGGGGQLTCESEYLLTEGTHTVHYVGGEVALDLTFAVPSVVGPDTQCAPMSR